MTTPADEVPFPVGDAPPAPAPKVQAAAPSKKEVLPSVPVTATPSPAPGLKLVPPQPTATTEFKNKAGATPPAPGGAAPSFFDEPVREDYAGRRVPASAAFADEPSEGDAPPDSDIERLKSALEKRRKPFLVVALEGARRVGIEGDELCVEFAPEGKHLRDSLAKPDNAKILREACREIFGRDVGVRIVVTDAGTSADAPLTEQDEARLEKQRLREIAEQDPLVQQIIKTFRAEIVDVSRTKSEA